MEVSVYAPLSRSCGGHVCTYLPTLLGLASSFSGGGLASFLGNTGRFLGGGCCGCCGGCGGLALLKVVQLAADANLAAVAHIHPPLLERLHKVANRQLCLAQASAGTSLGMSCTSRKSAHHTYVDTVPAASTLRYTGVVTS